MKKQNKKKTTNLKLILTLSGLFLCLLIILIALSNHRTNNPQIYISKAESTYNLLNNALQKTSNENNEELGALDWKNVRLSNNKSQAIIKELAKDLPLSECETPFKNCFSDKGYITLNGVKSSVITDEMEAPEIKQDNANYIASYTKESEDEYGYSIERKIPLLYLPAKPKFSSTYFVLENGSVGVLKTYSTYCSGQISTNDTSEIPNCGVFYIDVNGKKAPNTLGIDVFGYYLSGNKIIPMGFLGDNFFFEENCLKQKPDSNKYNGLGCSAWVIQKKNMEYRKCLAGKRLGWNIANTCKDIPR